MTDCERMEELLPLYVEGEATADERKLVEEHLDQCEDCREMLPYLQTVSDGLAALPVVPEQMRSRLPTIDERVRQRTKRRGLGLLSLRAPSGALRFAGTAVSTLFIGALALGLWLALGQMQGGAVGDRANLASGGDGLPRPTANTVYVRAVVGDDNGLYAIDVESDRVIGGPLLLGRETHGPNNSTAMAPNGKVYTRRVAPTGIVIPNPFCPFRELLILDPARGWQRTELSLPVAVEAVEVSSDGKAFIARQVKADRQEESLRLWQIEVYDTSDDALIKTEDVIGSVSDIYAGGDGLVYVSHTSDLVNRHLSDLVHNRTSDFADNPPIPSGITVIRGSDLQVVAEIPLKRYSPSDLALGPDGLLYGTVERRLAPGESELDVNAEWETTGLLVAIDPDKRQVVAEIEVPNGAYGLAITPEGKAYILHRNPTQGGQPSQVSVYDLKEGKLLKELPIGKQGTFIKQVSPTRVYAGTYGINEEKGKVWVIDTSSDDIIETIEVGDRPEVIVTLPKATPTPTPEVAFTREQAVAKATESAKQSAPGMDMLEVKIDRVTTELVERALFSQNPDLDPQSRVYGPNQNADTPVWWVIVEGYFRWQGPPTEAEPAPMYEAFERSFVYDSSTGEELSSGFPSARPAVTPLPGGAWKTYSSVTCGVTLQYPSNWGVMAEFASDEGYGGYDGYFILMPADFETLDAAVEAQAYGTDRYKPYGSSPTIKRMQIQGQEARLILPSEDQPENAKGDAQLIVVYPEPIQFRGRACKYLLLSADKDHIEAIAETLEFSAPEQSTQPPGGLLTLDDAKARVRAFLGEPQAVIEGRFQETPVLTPGVESLKRFLMSRQVAGVAEADTFIVDATTGEVTEATIVSNTPLGAPNKPVTEPEARGIAADFARAHFADFSHLTATDARTDELDGSPGPDIYRATWNVVAADSGAIMPTFVRVGVDLRTGRVTDYQSWRFDYQGPTMPTVSREQATQAALAEASNDARLANASVRQTRLAVSATPKGYWLAWIVLVAGAERNDSFTVDALTGEVLNPVGTPRG